MDKELFTSLEQILKQLGSVGALALPVAIAYSIWRTGSFHLIRRRLWLILYGKDEVADQAIRGIASDQSSLTLFRWTFGVRARTLKQAQTLGQWSDQYDENLHAVGAAGPYFDIEKFEIDSKLPDRRRRAGWVTMAFGFTAMMFVLIGPSAMTRVYYQVKATGLWFSASKSNVQEAGPSVLSTSRPYIIWPVDSQPLTLQMCKDNKFPSDTFGRSQSKVLCEFLTAPDKDKKFDADLQAQTFVLGYFFSCFGVVLAMMMLDYLRLAAAWKLKERLEQKTKQMAFQFE